MILASLIGTPVAPGSARPAPSGTGRPRATPPAAPPPSGHPRPFRREGLVGRSLPFIVVACGSFVFLTTTTIDRPAATIAAGGLTAFLILLVFTVPWERLPDAAQPVIPLACFFVVVLAREGTGGSASVLTPLIIIPPLWLALYGTRREMGLAMVGAALTLLVPVALGDSSRYGTDGLTRAGIWMLFLPLIGYIVRGRVAALRRSETQLTAAAQRFRSVTNAAQEAVVAADGEGRIVLWNPGAGTIFGHSEEEALKMNLTELMPERFRALHRDGLARASRGGETRLIGRTVELAGLRRNGSEFPLDLVLGRWSEGGRSFYTGLIRDVTERKRLDDELSLHREHLEDLVDERTTALTAANQELEAFSYAVSHDLRAPLRSIDGFSQVLLEDHGESLDAEGREYLERVRASSQRMATLIDDLLDLSRITRREMVRGPVDLSALAREVLDELRERDPGRDVETVVADGLVAHGDPRLLRVVLDNLIGNAWKFTARREHARIECGCSPETSSPPTTAYFVRDDGAGFDMAYADKLFGAFQRLHGMTEFEGTGIGLATVQRIIHRHGGRVWAEGQIDRGATFYFTLAD